MLVMSRRCDEEIQFPNLGITVKVLRMQGNRVRLGVNAPEEIDVIRGELVGESDSRRTSEADHKLRNELNGLMLATRMFQMQMERGLEDKAHQTYLEMLHKLKQLDASYRPIATTIAPEESASLGSHVLVVEDDANERELLAGLLRMEGCEVATAGDGIDALDRLAKVEQRPDVVLLDMHMPRVNGVETLSCIRSNPQLRDLLVFGVSGRTPNDVGLSVGTPDGIDDWFQKPLNPVEIVTRIRRDIKGAATIKA